MFYRTYSPRYAMLALAASILILGGCNKGDNTKDARGSQASKDSAPVTVVVADLIKESKADAAATDKKYMDKVIEFEGLVFVPPDPVTTMLLVKDPGAKEPAPGTIKCMVGSAHIDKARALKPEQKVKVKGLYGGIGGDFVNVINAELIEIGPAPN